MFGLLLLALAGPVPSPDGGSVVANDFVGTRQAVPSEIRNKMARYSWRPGCPVPIEDLSYLRLSHWGYDGVIHVGELVVHRDLAAETITIFRQLFEHRFPIEKMHLVDDYEGDDNRSMEDNNTSGFNCRPVPGHTVLSKHSYGRAIDINPRVNPYVTPGGVSPASGAAFVDRSQHAPGLISPSSACYRAFVDQGWHWGGHWKRSQDYQHFEK